MACNAPTASADPKSSPVVSPSLIIGTRSVNFTFSLSCNFVEKIFASLLLKSWNLFCFWEGGMVVCVSYFYSSFLLSCVLTFLVVILRCNRIRRRPYRGPLPHAPFQVAYSSSYVPPLLHQTLLPPRSPPPRYRDPHQVWHLLQCSTSASYSSSFASRPL